MTTTDTGLGDLIGRARKLRQDSYADLQIEVTETASATQQLHPNQRRAWLPHVLEDLWDEQDGRCAICGQPLLDNGTDVDHRIPFRYGGGNERANLQITHARCNRSKGAKIDGRSLLRYLEDRFMNR